MDTRKARNVTVGGLGAITLGWVATYLVRGDIGVVIAGVAIVSLALVVGLIALLRHGRITGRYPRFRDANGRTRVNFEPVDEPSTRHDPPSAPPDADAA